MMCEMYDSKTDRLIYVGTMQECLDRSKEEPDRKFYIVDKETTKTKK